MPVDEPTPAANRQLDFLLADFGALKAEIARRSGLQRVAVALYLGLVAAVAASLPEGKNLSLSAAGLWIGGLVALLFWCREHREITRLGRLIRDRIGEKAGAILNVPKEDIVPSEAAASIDERMDSTTRRYHLWFMWLVFFVIPLLLTLHALWQRLAEVSRFCARNTPTPCLVFVILLSIAGNFWLLVKQCRGRQKRDLCKPFRDFDKAYMSLVSNLTKGDLAAATKDYGDWIRARDQCRSILVDAAAGGRLDVISLVDAAVEVAYASLNGSWEDLLQKYPEYVKARGAVFPALCPKDMISHIASAVKIEPGAFGIKVDIKKLLGANDAF